MNNEGSERRARRQEEVLERVTEKKEKVYLQSKKRLRGLCKSKTPTTPAPGGISYRDCNLLNRLEFGLGQYAASRRRQC